MNNQYKIRTFKCFGCGKKVTERRPSNNLKYCSLECYRDSDRPQRKSGKTIKCEMCGKKKYKPKSQLKRKNHFCSIACANKYQGRNKVSFTCKICNKKFRLSKSLAEQEGRKVTYCSMACRGKDTEFMRNCGLSSTIKQQKNKGLNKLEMKGREILTDIGIEFEEQVLMFDKFLVDVLIPSKKLIIQWDGVYWHTKPKRMLLDKSQDAYFKKSGYKVLRVTDKEIKNNIGKVYANIKRAIR